MGLSVAGLSRTGRALIVSSGNSNFPDHGAATLRQVDRSASGCGAATCSTSIASAIVLIGRLHENVGPFGLGASGMTINIVEDHVGRLSIAAGFCRRGHRRGAGDRYRRRCLA